MANVTLESLRKVYDQGDIVAVDDLSLEIEDGEFVTVVGPSGCGKTTTLRMLAGLEMSSDGRIEIGEEDVTGISAKQRDVAMVFQNYALYPHKTVFENMEFGLRMSTDLTADEREQRVVETAEMMGIESLLEDKPDELSGGQKQRVALGRAIVREPDVFLFDEPLSNLDAKLRTTMRAEIQHLQNELGITAIYVTHDQEEAMTMGDRIVILNDGELQQVGAPKYVYENPINQFVGGFIGSPSMNFVDVVATANSSGISLESADGQVQYQLSNEYVDALEMDLDETRLTLGIRPENISLSDAKSRNAVEADVEVVELIGSDNHIHLDIADSFIARVDSDIQPDVGETISITFDEDHVHLFSQETGYDILADKQERKKATAASLS
ncbi:sn-glycerol-3-phosphate ABC transporter ATP-binding protein UgpC [Natronolimnobius sp. AArcel1]|uniref:ABC transporter ATP-binding protein n=1 Tax=Natronolimnobius sp. AArcel1 TaxID=1679093 RepID=UPI0013EA9B4D|nr:sn-glycerol-3-phosphate ABC transporter ATP-binding protein UgpC [Natronolimnobius sp. AArcel1]NGM71128.1 sn-glycerol-3-phosphate ABC transporter ATP-binding protein UgpC [Natronolimnobius sp. AArcel1]